MNETTKLRLRRLAADALHYSGALRLLPLEKVVGNPYPWRILMYHRVVDPENVPYPLQPGMYVRPRTFEMHMRYLCENADVMPLDELAIAIAEKKPLPRKPVAVSFDDGWVDAYEHAFPVLQRYSIPATIFIVTSFVGTNETLWGDKLGLAIRALRGETQYQASVNSRIKANSALPSGVSDRLLTLLSQPEESVINSLDEFIEALKNTSLKERKVIVSTITNLAKEFTGMKIPRSFLNWDEVKEMADSGIKFGSHSHKHYPFDQLSEAQASDELDNSYQTFREKGLPPSVVFCYPGGNLNDTAQQALNQKEIRFALTVSKTPRLDSLPMLLSRIGMHEDISETIPLFTARVWAENFF